MALQFVDTLFQPLFTLPYWFSILIISFIITLLITLAYKWMTDQELMKRLKDDIKKFQEDTKKEKENPAKMLDLQKKAMDTNMQYMMHSMKPTLITFIPIILIFSYLNNALVYEPIVPGQEFDIALTFISTAKGMVTLDVSPGISAISKTQEIKDGIVIFRLKGEEGTYKLVFRLNGAEYTKDVVITTQQKYEPPVKKFQDSELKQIQVMHNYVRPFGSISIFGWNPGWLAAYIIFSLIFSLALRKIMKIH